MRVRRRLGRLEEQAIGSCTGGEAEAEASLKGVRTHELCAGSHVGASSVGMAGLDPASPKARRAWIECYFPGTTNAKALAGAKAVREVGKRREGCPLGYRAPAGMGTRTREAARSGPSLRLTVVCCMQHGVHGEYGREMGTPEGNRVIRQDLGVVVAAMPQG